MDVVRTERCCIKRIDKHFNILDKNAFFNDLRGGGGGGGEGDTEL
jgi:hypothetical protein